MRPTRPPQDRSGIPDDLAASAGQRFAMASATPGPTDLGPQGVNGDATGEQMDGEPPSLLEFVQRIERTREADSPVLEAKRHMGMIQTSSFQASGASIIA